VKISPRLVPYIPIETPKRWLPFRLHPSYSIWARGYCSLTQFYEDFLEEITQSDPELDKYGLVKSFNKKYEENISTPVAGYRKYPTPSHQTESPNRRGVP
jgi:hypothetical protein